MTSILEELRMADPAADFAPTPPEPVLRRILAQPDTTRAARLRRRPALLAAGVAAAGAAALVTVTLSGGQPDLAARAYAQTAPDDSVVHSVEVSHSTVTLTAAGGRTMRSSDRVERWQRGERAHVVIAVEDDGKTSVYDQVLSADGVLRNRLPDGTVQELRDDDGGEAAEIIADEKRDPIARFRRLYAARQLQDAGETTLAGQAVHAYVRTERIAVRSGGVQTTRETFYLDAKSAEPVGYRSQAANRSGRFETIATIQTFERLDPTPQNLAKLGG
jgi:hypothetical protein